jgi:hypothetical protein
MDNEDFDFNPYDAIVEAHERIQRLELVQGFMAQQLANTLEVIKQQSIELNKLAVEIQTDRLTNLTRLYPAPADETKRMQPWYRNWFK